MTDDTVDLSDDVTGTAPPSARALLELNGYNTVRTEALGAANTIGNMPPDAIDAAVAYAEAASRRLRLNAGQQAADARQVADLEGRLLRAVAKFRRDLDRVYQSEQTRRRLDVKR